MKSATAALTRGRPARWREGSSRSGVARGKQASKRRFGGGGISRVKRGGGDMVWEGNPGGGQANRRGN